MTSYQLDGAVLEEGTGLTGAGPSFSSTPAGSVQRSRQHPALHAAAVSENDALAEFNARAAGPQLKLGPRIPLPEKLQNEVDRELRDEERRERERERAAKEAASAAAGEQAGEGGKEGQPEGANGEAMQGVEATGGPANASKGAKEEGKEGTPAPRSARTPTPAPDARASDAPVTTSEDGANGKLSSGLLAPTLEDLPPQPPSFRTVDVWREVERVRDARKRIRLDPALASGGSGFLTGVRDAMVNGMGEEGAKAARAAALPSVCAYTYHDAEDG